MIKLMNEYLSNWFQTYFREKQLGEETWTFYIDGESHKLSTSSIQAFICSNLDVRLQMEIKKQLVYLDYYNQDIQDYLRYLAKSILDIKLHHITEVGNKR
ncbi:hypothetical protein [Priestia koreensis]|uniref:Uncharacterized protein n=1 Tax=Priestia koreensis TaxID=284581 RepID=A0A0M0KND5_9BACI|nr:hypothetical protein [Priestia koreensis]KOO40315.1 hypothetical protein AMD01_21430 [Priestia koreensis]